MTTLKQTVFSNLWSYFLAYKSQLEERKQQTVELENSTVALDEQTMKLHKQFAFNQENFERLTVLSEHVK